jgi:hypothetical protein
MEIAMRLKTLRQRFHEYGFWKFSALYGTRLAKTIFPACVFRAREGILMEMAEICPEKIPTLRGFETRIATQADLSGLCSVSPRPKAFLRLFDGGSICVVAQSSDSIVAIVWAQVGPGVCTVDDSYRHGYRWRLEAGDAWIHNSISHPDFRNSGVYLVAYRRLLEELAGRGVSRCYSLINESNRNSLRVHSRLQMHPIVYLSYRRILFYGRYQICHRENKVTAWTIRRSFTFRIRNFRKPLVHGASRKMYRNNHKSIAERHR